MFQLAETSSLSVYDCFRNVTLLVNLNKSQGPEINRFLALIIIADYLIIVGRLND